MSQTFGSPYQWNFYSSNGRSSLGGNFHRIWRDSNGFELILAEISIVSLWINRCAENISFADLQKDVSVTLSQVVVSRKKVEELIKELAIWFDSSVIVSKDLCEGSKDQSLKLYLGPPDPKMSLEKIVLEIQYSGVTFESGKWSFSIDQSCVKIFIDELRLALDKLGHCA